MEETLGKRIIANRKRLGMTQDKLAEQLGVTAQAVSKWENDQSCPDITMLPKLAEIFGISVDALLGVAAQEKAVDAEVVEPVTEEDEQDGIHLQQGNWEFHWDGGRKSSLGIAFWVLLVGALLMADSIWNLNVDFWDVLWSSGLLTFGLFGILPRFSFFRLGCLLFGTYFLLSELDVIPYVMGKDFLLPAFLLLFGLSLLVDALKKPAKHKFSFHRNGKNIKKSHCSISDERFECDLSFGEKSYLIDAPRLLGGKASANFGELVIDLSGCEEVAPDCTVEADCSFGELTLRVPRRWRVEADSSTSFGNFEVEGSPASEPAAIIKLDASVSFGNICVEYI